MEHGKYVVIVDYGSEGWKPWVITDSLKDALSEWYHYVQNIGALTPAKVVYVIDPLVILEENAEQYAFVYE